MIYFIVRRTGPVFTKKRTGEGGYLFDEKPHGCSEPFDATQSRQTLMKHEVIVTCAVTGSGDTTTKHPGVPITPQQIAQSAIEAADAGAAIVHIHVRDPHTGRGS